MKKFISNLVTPIVARVLHDLMWDNDTIEDLGNSLADGFVKRIRSEFDYDLAGSLDYDKALVALSAVIQKNLPKTKAVAKPKIKKGF
jgi:hypothetical protein